MSIPFGNETVTLVRRTETMVGGKTHVTYSRVTLTGCSWRRARRWQRDGEFLVPVESVVCRIPASQTKPSVGDLLILGNVAVTVTSGMDYQRVIEQYAGQDGAFMVASVSDNTRPGMPLPHWVARS